MDSSLNILMEFIVTLIFVISLINCEIYEEETFIGYLSKHIRNKREDAQPGNANQYFDELLNNTRELIVDRGWDPLEIGEVDICSHCKLEGLTTIKRTGDTTLTQDNEDVVLHTNVGFGELFGTCHCAKKVLFITFRGILRTKLVDLAMKGTIRTNTRGNIRPILEDFSVTNNGNMDLYWDGKGFLAFLSEAVFKLFKSKFRYHAQTAIPGLLRSAIENNLHKINSLSGP